MTKKTMKYLVVAMTMFLVVACSDPEEQVYVEVVAQDFKFQVADEIPSGLNTFKFKNAGHAEHFFLLNKLPDDIDFQTYKNEVTIPFDMVFDSLKSGVSKADAGAMLGTMIPPWYFSGVKAMGGPGIVSAGGTAQTTMELVPGNYVMECYIKEQGVFHTSLGMIKPIKVSHESTGSTPPTANMEITLSNYTMDIEGKVQAGSNTVAVHFREHPEIGLGNDVHLIQLDENTNMDEVIYWLDWMNIEGLQSPAPVKFLGGTQEMPVGSIAYFTIDLAPGSYAWIAETTAAQGMVMQFIVE